MNIKTGNGMGIKPKGIAWKPNYGMGIKTGKGMGLKTTNGMGLSTDKNYFKFNEYERKRKYLQMGSGVPGPPRSKVNNKPVNNSKPKENIAHNNNNNNAPVKATAPKEPAATTSFQARQKWGAAAATINAAAAFNSNINNKGEKYKHKNKTETPPPREDVGASVGSVKRTMSLFEQLLYV